MQRAAYWYGQALGARDTTKEALDEWSTIQKELKWYVDAGYEDADILAIMAENASSYKMLGSMFGALPTGAAAQTTESIGYSPDALVGVLWAIRNGQTVGDPKKDYSVEMAKYFKGLDREKAKTRNPADDSASDAFTLIPARRAA